MTWMNEWDIEEALRLTAMRELPNLRRGAETLARLKDWTNENSDGWPYWPKPGRAANKLMELLEAATSEWHQRLEVSDVSEAQIRAAIAPIKAFLTRQGVPHEEVVR